MCQLQRGEFCCRKASAKLRKGRGRVPQWNHRTTGCIWLAAVDLQDAEVCLTSPFRAKEFLPGGVRYNPNPRELFRAPAA
jgi:hypothetical protein